MFFRRTKWLYNNTGRHFLVIARRVLVADDNMTLDRAGMGPDCASHLNFTHLGKFILVKCERMF